MISIIDHDSSEGEQWDRYNLPRYIHIYAYINLSRAIHNYGLM